ncbi:hypothetical protein CEXT_782071, partial [Caerostris extrusa]
HSRTGTHVRSFFASHLFRVPRILASVAVMQLPWRRSRREDADHRIVSVNRRSNFRMIPAILDTN